jgi:hypothetical protein
LGHSLKGVIGRNREIDSIFESRSRFELLTIDGFYFNLAINDVAGSVGLER